MDSYNKILNQIKNDLKKEDVISNENIINLYDFYNIIYMKLKKLTDITNEEKIFINKGFFNNNFHKRVLFNIDSKKMTIRVVAFDDRQSFDICKEYNIGKLNFFPQTEQNKKYINKFMKKYYNEIINIFSVIEEYSSILLALPNTLQISDKNGIYGLNLRFCNLGKIDIICFFNNADELNYYNKDYIINLIDESKFELAKKIKININELDDVFKNIINEYFVNKSKKVK